MTKQVHVNLTSLVNASKIRHETRDGRKVVILPSATLPTNVVMNKIRYTDKAIADSFHTLEGTPAPLGHPTVNGKFVSAKEPQGLVRSFIGAWNENVRRENGRVFLDKVIDVEFAEQTESGRRVLDAVNKQKPIHTSTGLLASLKPLDNASDGAEWETDTMIFDHDAVLLDEPGAATPEQGVGIFVNSDGAEIEVINSAIEDDIETILREGETKDHLGLLNRIKSVIEAVVRGEPVADVPRGHALNQETTGMDKAQFDELKGMVASLANTVAELKVDDKIAEAVKPLIEAQEAQLNAQKAADEAKHAELVNKVVKAELLTEEVAKAADVAVLNALLEKHDAAPKGAMHVNGAFKANAGEFNPLDFAPEGD